jgi:voltage-gated potassium channel
MKKELNLPYVVFILVISVIAIVDLAVQTLFTLDPVTVQVLSYFDYVICLLFFIDFLVQFLQAEHKLRYFVTWGWIDLLSSVPVIPALRIARVTRVLRIFRVLRTIKSARLITRAILEKRAQSAILAILLVVILVIGIAAISVIQFELPADGNIKTAGDAVWWAIVTITTVGYGDKFPITPEGRIIGTVLMIVGISLFGTISGFAASWILSLNEEKIETEEKDIRKELEEIKQMLIDMKKKDLP